MTAEDLWGRFGEVEGLDREILRALDEADVGEAMAAQQTRWRLARVATASLLLVAGCGSRIAGSGEDVSTIAGSEPIEVKYVMRGYRIHVITDGGRARVKFQIGPGPYAEKILLVWDGTRIMEFSNSNATPYTIYEHPDEQRDLMKTVATWADRRPDTTGCVKIGPTTIIGRPAVGYRCPPANPTRRRFGSTVIWIDQATGILLKNQVSKNVFMVAQTLDLHPTVDASTFSTEPPDDADVRVVSRGG